MNLTHEKMGQERSCHKTRGVRNQTDTREEGSFITQTQEKMGQTDPDTREEQSVITLTQDKMGWVRHDPDTREEGSDFTLTQEKRGRASL